MGFDMIQTHAKQLRRKIRGDGCTGAPDLSFRKCCDYHDLAYQTHRNTAGHEITRAEADRAFLECMKRNAPGAPIAGRLLPYFYYLAVRIFGSAHWKEIKRNR